MSTAQKGAEVDDAKTYQAKKRFLVLEIEIRVICSKNYGRFAPTQS